jgi:hypothetical protein
MAVVADVRRVAAVGGERSRQVQSVPSGIRPGAMRCFVRLLYFIGTCERFLKSYGRSLVFRNVPSGGLCTCLRVTTATICDLLCTASCATRGLL